ncbi:hypothetical protein GPALN_013271 [Globodera pallida]|nr:hypothetical protein GPALN_013271 [Globodera pallida]
MAKKKQEITKVPQHGRFSAFVPSAWPLLWHRHGRFCGVGNGRFSGIGMAVFVASAMAAFQALAWPLLWRRQWPLFRHRHGRFCAVGETSRSCSAAC